jgi:CRISPR/Cas system CMR subunit Cmr6 (Cas7 group RAMP superfamily)
MQSERLYLQAVQKRLAAKYDKMQGLLLSNLRQLQRSNQVSEPSSQRQEPFVRRTSIGAMKVFRHSPPLLWRGTSTTPTDGQLDLDSVISSPTARPQKAVKGTVRELVRILTTTRGNTINYTPHLAMVCAGTPTDGVLAQLRWHFGCPISLRLL